MLRCALCGPVFGCGSGCSFARLRFGGGRRRGFQHLQGPGLHRGGGLLGSLRSLEHLFQTRPEGVLWEMDIDEAKRSTEELRQLFRDAAKQPRFKGILQAMDEPLVSIDYKGDPHSSSVDLPFTMVLGKEKSNFVKVVTWYDNEWGYSCRTADLAALMAKSL